jgi:Domain of unknown function (DUF4465)
MFINHCARWQRAVLFSTLLVGAVIGLHPGGVARGDFVIGTFEDQSPGPNIFKNDFSPANTFTTGGFTLSNNFISTSDWFGFSVSSKVDNTFSGDDLTHQYGAYAPLGANGTGAGGSATYGVAYNFSRGDAVINLPSGTSPVSMDVTNTTYTAQSITQGDSFARAFHQGDSFRLDILGYSGANGTGTQVGDIPFYLADYQGSSLQLVSNWTTVSLSPLAGAMSLEFSLTSLDVGQFGLNTPAYFAADNLIAQTTTIPEPSSWLLCLIGCGVSLLASRLKKGRR